MTDGIQTILYPATDLAAAKAAFIALIGAEPEQDQPYYVGWQVGGQTFGLVPHADRQGLTGPTPYWHVADIGKSIEAMVDAGATVTAKPRDVGGGRLTATVTVDGNIVGLLQDPVRE
jgi:predicted enzyme related to lactoylglutathione lyase